MAALAFVIVVPLAIFGGVVAALKFGKPTDRIISVAGLTATVIPEVVSGDRLHPRARLVAEHPADLGVRRRAASSDTIYHLIMPAIPLVLILFGYIEQMARAGTVEALNSDYARTATLKGLPRGVVIRRHVLRNSLLPTITVIATQTGYLIGGLVVVEILFNWHGIGQLLLQRGHAQGLPDARGGSSDDRRGLRVRDAHRRHHVLAAEPADPVPGLRVSGYTIQYRTSATSTRSHIGPQPERLHDPYRTSA